MENHSRGLVVGGHDGCFLIIDRVNMDYVFGVRSHNGEVLSVYLRNDDIEKIAEFLSRKGNYPVSTQGSPITGPSPIHTDIAGASVVFNDDSPR